MAPKRLKEDPPPATTSSGEEEESENDAVSEEEEEKEKSENEEEEEEDDDDDDEQEEEHEKSPAGKPTVIPSKPQPLSGSDTESGSETDSDSGSDPKSPPTPSASAFTIKPIASKPMAQVPLKPAKANNSATISVSGSSKRAAESDSNKATDSKKRKIVSSSSTTTTNGDDEDPKKAPGAGPGVIQRLWGEEDELTVLKGMIEYGSKTGSDPYADMGVFHEFIKKSLRVEVSKTQLMDKIRRMRKKYQTNFDKGGHDMVFSKPHERKSFELSKKIWGTQTTPKPKTNTNSVTLALPRQEVVENGGGVEGFWESYPCLRAAFETTADMGFPGLSGLGTGTRFVRELMARIGSRKLKEMEDKCSEVKVAQLEVFVKRMELAHELGEVVLGAMKKRLLVLLMQEE